MAGEGGRVAGWQAGKRFAFSAFAVSHYAPSMQSAARARGAKRETAYRNEMSHVRVCFTSVN